MGGKRIPTEETFKLGHYSSNLDDGLAVISYASRAEPKSRRLNHRRGSGPVLFEG